MIHEDVILPESMPVFLKDAEYLSSLLKGMSLEELKQLWKCSDKLAEENLRRLEHMDLHNGLTPAVWSYSGLAYQSLAVSALTDKETDYLQKHLRILSGMYGVLKPMDGIAEYRLEMQAALANRNGNDLYAFWSDRIYREVTEGDHVIIDAASKEYSRCITDHLKPEDTYIECVFAQLKGSKPVVKGTMAKMARGAFVRWMAENRIEDAEEIRNFDRGYAYAPEYSGESRYVFLQKQEIGNEQV